jgi:HK97 family phage portal protein
VELLASSVAGVDLVAERWDPEAGIWAKLAEQPSVLTDPILDGTAWDWRYACVRDLIEAGNHLALLGDEDWRTGKPGWLIPLPIGDVALITDPARPGGYWFALGGWMLDPSNVFHISAGNRSFEVLGQGVIAQYSQALGQSMTAEEWSGRYLSGGGLPPAIIQYPGQPTQTQMDQFKALWNALVTTGEAIVIPANATVTPLQSDAQRQQLVEARTWNSELQAMMLGIPPYKLGLPGPTMTYQNVETGDIAWVIDGPKRWGDPIEHRTSKHLLPRGTRARFAWAGRLRTDQATQASVLTTYVGAGILSVDEARQAAGYGPMVRAIEAGTTPAGAPELGAKEVT